jgi:hypothetical protein
VERTGSQRRAISVAGAGPPFTTTLCFFEGLMSKLSLLLLGALSLIPLLGFFLLLALAPRLTPALYPSNPHLLFQIGLAYVVSSWIIVIAAMVLGFRLRHLQRTQKILWVIALFFFNMFALPAFWYKCVWKPTLHAET